MKRLFLFLLSLAYLLNGASAQTREKTGFLFDQFKDGIVFYRDGRQFGVPLNYNLITNQYVFIDKNDGNQEKEFTEASLIVAIEVDGHTFLPPSEGATEVIQTEPPFYVTYEGTIRNEKGVAFGGSTQTASVDSYNQIRGVGQVGGADGTKKSVAAVNKEYKIKIGKKRKRFSNEKQFLKLFPMQKEVLAQYIEEKQVDFDQIRQVLELYNHARLLP